MGRMHKKMKSKKADGRWREEWKEEKGDKVHVVWELRGGKQGWIRNQGR